MSDEKLREEGLQEEDLKDSEEVELQEEKAEAEAVSEEVDDLKSTLIRLQADFNNYRNRVDKERSQTLQYATESLVTKLLSVLDNFDRALGSCEESPSIQEGFCLIKQELLDILGKEGLKEIEADGKQFDPNFHHAVITEESDEESGMILETFQKGYMLGDRVIRASMVKVAK